MRFRASSTACLGLAALACGGGGEGPEVPGPTGGGFGILSGAEVLVLTVQYVERTDDGWIGGARGEREALSQADREIAFALGEQRSRATWILPEEQAEMLNRQPSIEIDPYMLTADQVRSEGSDLDRITDPLYGEIRMMAALLDTRYAVWPYEFFYYEPKEEGASRVALRTLLLDVRTGDVLWQGIILGDESPPTSPAALASAAQAFAERVSP